MRHPPLLLLLILLILSLSASRVLHATTFYLDPSAGSLNNPGTPTSPWPALEAVVQAGLIESRQYTTPYNPTNPVLTAKNTGAPVQAGDTLILLNGLHGNLILQNFINEQMITIMAAEGQSPTLRRIHLQGAKNWRLEELLVSGEPYGDYHREKLVYLESHNWQGPVSHIEVRHCEIYSTLEPWTTAGDWLAKVSDGLYLRGDSLLAENNLIRNIDMGLTALGDHITARNNQIVNFSGDGMRPLGSYILFEGNLIKNCYDVDDNHDDGIQSFTTGGRIVDHNIMRGNIIINREDANQPLSGPLQGMGFFDGFYHDWIVENNLIITDHWHGITFLGARDCRIINNTVLDPTPDLAPGPSWIMVAAHKDGRPSSGCIVKNNVTNDIRVDGMTGNNRVLSTYVEYSAQFVDHTSFNFHLLPGSDLIDAGDVLSAPDTDLEGIKRPKGALPDIGCYEYQGELSPTRAVEGSGGFRVYPNPVKDHLFVDGPYEDCLMLLLSSDGQLIRVSDSPNSNIVKMNTFPPGSYLLWIIKRNTGQRWGQWIIKSQN
ncbi:MAG: T9SS type A sorting domain-containing protein [Saprospiraceae bacterium]